MNFNLRKRLEQYQPYNEDEENSRVKILHFLDNEKNQFCRTNLKGHITGSGFLIDKSGKRVLMNLHKKLNKWMVFGGHSDGDPNTEDVALKEAQEESGILEIRQISGILDVDVHLIPENINKLEPAHYHYDICFLLQCHDTETFEVSDESHELRWCNKDQAFILTDDARMKRMIQKVF